MEDGGTWGLKKHTCALTSGTFMRCNVVLMSKTSGAYVSGGGAPFKHGDKHKPDSRSKWLSSEVADSNTHTHVRIGLVHEHQHIFPVRQLPCSSPAIRHLTAAGH